MSLRWSTAHHPLYKLWSIVIVPPGGRRLVKRMAHVCPKLAEQLGTGAPGRPNPVANEKFLCSCPRYSTRTLSFFLLGRAHDIRICRFRQ